MKHLNRILREFLPASLAFCHTDAVTITGEVDIIARRGSEIVQRITGQNLVVTAGKVATARLLGGDRTGAVVKIGIGVGTALPAIGDTTLTNPFLRAIESVSYPQPTHVRFHWLIPKEEGNGRDVTEYGLFFGDNTMIARITRGVIAKESDLSIEGTWTLRL